ncbi:MAG TPA: DUF2127 domain-containing protein [Acidobacteriaceae bacterium]|jgi:uncharacterized membrane protein (DUF2068 family)|nr:DUF2127 domain-containing protein [Acidobacteriaceae bacterium]
MTVSSLQIRASRVRSPHDQWIIAIGVFKLLQGALFILLGIGAIRLLHKDLMSVADHFILAMRFNPESHFVTLILEKVAMIDPHRMREISAAIFVVAALDIVEGTGLVLDQAWAEFVTLILTASFLPWEIFEILRHQTWIRVGLTLINLAVVIYLLYYVQARMRERRQRCHAGGA